MSNLPPVDGHYVDGRDPPVKWFPTDSDGGPVISELGEVERLTDVIRNLRPVTGLFPANEEQP